MRALIFAAFLFVVCLVSVAGWTPAQIPQKFTNLQVLPKDITQQELIGTMRNFCFNLDVRCQHCHVGDGDDLSKFDFVSDARPAKATARRMLKMVASLNEMLKDVGAPASGPKVTCYTCHRGALKPLTVPGGGRDKSRVGSEVLG